MGNNNRLVLKEGLALDIDGTLSATNYFWYAKFIEVFGNPEKLPVDELIKRYKFAQNVPFWQTKDALDLMEHFRESNEIQLALPLIDDAVEVIDKVQKIIPISCYLTTRPETVINGTRLWLKKYSFPDVPIIARPKDVSQPDGNKWKAKMIYDFYPTIGGIIDDNAEIVENIPTDYKGVYFLYDNETSPRSDINVIPCKKWADVDNEVEKYYSGKKNKN